MQKTAISKLKSRGPQPQGPETPQQQNPSVSESVALIKPGSQGVEDSPPPAGADSRTPENSEPDIRNPGITQGLQQLQQEYLRRGVTNVPRVTGQALVPAGRR